MRFEPLLPQEVRCGDRVDRDGGIADLDAIQQVESSHPGIPGEAVGGERAIGALAVRPHAAAGEEIGLARAHFDLSSGHGRRYR